MRRSLARAIAVAACGFAPWLAGGVAPASAITVSVAGRSAARPLANNYLGLAFTYQGISRWAGPASQPADPVLVQLIRNLTPHGRPVLRVGGVSADRSWWPITGYRKPIGIWDDLTPASVASLRGLARATQARLILGLNLEVDRPKLIQVESHELVRRIGRRYIESLQIGNEPNLYRTVPWYGLLNSRPVPQFLDTGSPVYSRSPSWGPAAYAAQIARLLPTLPRLPISGPDASGPNNGAASWLGAFARFLHPPGRAVTFTAHAYAAVKCVKDPASWLYPSIPHMLSLEASRSQLSGLSGFIALARGHGDGFRVDEMGTVSCSGLSGVSDSMASALWVLDALFSMDQAGVSGVNLHAINGVNALFVPRYSHGRWQATVEPWYYGALLFAQAAPAGARLLFVSDATNTNTRVWATLGEDHAVRVLVINDSIGSGARVRVRNPPGYGRGPATIERLRAPQGAYATSGVTLGGRSFGLTRTGVLQAPVTQLVSRRGGAYAVTLPPASAALLTLTKGGP